MKSRVVAVFFSLGLFVVVYLPEASAQVSCTSTVSCAQAAMESAAQSRAIAEDLKGQLSSVRMQLNKILAAQQGTQIFGGAYSSQDPVCNQVDHRDNSITGGRSCPPGFTASVVGRFRGAESGCGVTQYVCLKGF
jgi:hypothetical protein